MNKLIRSCYYNLNLPFTSTIEEVKINEKLLIKIQRAKALKTGKPRKKQIDKIIKDSEMIVDYINKNGVPAKENYFISTPKNIIAQTCVLIVVCVIAIIGYFSLI